MPSTNDILPVPSVAPGASAVTGLPDPEVLIREARRRQRRRYLLIGGALASVIALSAAMLTGLARPSAARPPSRPRPVVHEPRPAARPVGRASGQIPASTATTVVMWPAGAPVFTATSGPGAYLDNLAAGTLTQSQRPSISAGDYQPLLIKVGGYLVYVGNGTTAVRADLTGRPRVLAATPFFAPAAAPGYVWVENATNLGVIRSAAVASGRIGPPVTLPHGSGLVAGTDDGLLLQERSGRLALWKPGAALRLLPYAPSWPDGIDVTSRFVAYTTGCRDEETSGSSAIATAGFSACRMLRVLDVVTGRVRSFAAPARTAGWVPNGFLTVSAISDRYQMLAAYAAERPVGAGRVRLYLLRVSGQSAHATAVPSSGALLHARTAWSASGGWLLYQSRGRLWAYQPATGKVRGSSLPCCQYTVMIAVRSGRTGRG